MPPPHSNSEGPWLGGVVLRRMDQLTVAGLVLLAVVATGAWWIGHGGLRGRLLEVERAGPLRANFLVDVNTASWPELAQLPGIGELLARRIVSDRELHGAYASQRDLLRVRGIGPRTFERMLPYLQAIDSQEAIAGR